MAVTNYARPYETVRASIDRPLVAVVLAGGTGTRLYPASSSDRPTQFLSLVDDRSLLARTVDRVAFADERYVVTRQAYADDVREREHRGADHGSLVPLLSLA